MATDDNGGTQDSVGKPVFSFDSDSGTPSAARSDNGGNPRTVDPASLAGNRDTDTGTVGGGGRKQRSDKGQSRGSRKDQGAKAQPLDLGFVEFALFGIHSMLASSLHVPEFELTQGEAAQLSKAVGNVAQYYPVAIDPKMQAWVALFAIAGSLYGSRAVAYYARINTEAKRGHNGGPPLDAGSNVTELRPA